MKKMIISAVAALALLFGFASCSGDLHDMAAPDKLYIVGDMDGTFAPMTKSDNSFLYTFTYSNSMSAWGGGNGTANFKFTFANAWTEPTSIGNDSKDAVPEIGAETGFELTEASNPANITVTDFADGQEYTIICAVNASGTYTVKIEGNKFEPVPCNLVLVDESGNTKETPIVCTGDTSWKYQFTNDADGSLKFYVKRAGAMYYAPNADVSLNTEIGSAAMKWSATDIKAYFSFAYKANSSYTMLLDASDDSMRITCMEDDDSIIGGGAFVGSTPGLDWTGSVRCPMYKVSEGVFEYKFTANDAESSFTIQKTAGSWDDRWCGETNDDNCKGSGSSAVPGGEKVKMGRYNSGDPKHFTLTGMVSGNEYTVRVTVEKNEAMTTDGADVYIKLIGEKAVEKPFKEQISPLRIIGIFTDWAMSANPTVSSDGLTMTFGPFTAKDPETTDNANNPWGLCSDSAWTTKYTGGVLSLDGNAVSLEKGNGSNNTITGLSTGDKFNIVITIDEAEKTVSASAQKAQ